MTEFLAHHDISPLRFDAVLRARIEFNISCEFENLLPMFHRLMYIVLRCNGIPDIFHLCQDYKMAYKGPHGLVRCSALWFYSKEGS